MDRQEPVITIDGPSGAGKGTVSQALAQRLGWHFLDSGALYRLTALAVLVRGIDPDAEDQVAVLAQHLDARFDSAGQVYLDGDEVSRPLREEKTGLVASRIAALPEVRHALLARQRHFRQAPGLVADGRDMGTVVFPDARVKVFLTASAEERAQRRYDQLGTQGYANPDYQEILHDIRARDERDQQRSASPLLPASDAVLVDSTHMTVEEVLEALSGILADKGMG